MSRHWRDPVLRRAVVSLALLALTLLLVLRLYVLPELSGAPSASHWAVVNQIIDSLLAALFSSLVVGLVVLWLTIPDKETKAVSVIRAPLINEQAPRACKDCEYWWYRGHSGAFVRTVVMPALANASRVTRSSRSVRLLLLDPSKQDVLSEFVQFRNSVVRAAGKGLTLESVRNRILATILAAHLWGQSSSLLKVEVFLSSRFSLFRLDLCDQFALITTEDPREPALRVDRESSLWRAWKVEFEMQTHSATPLTLADTGARSEPDVLRELLPSIGIQKELPRHVIDAILADVNEAKNPYGRWPS